MVSVLLPREPVGSNDKSPLINILAIVLLIVTFFAVLTRLSTRYVVSRTLGWDDAAITGALLVHTGQVVAIFAAASTGLGRHFSSLSPEDAERFQKALYANQLLLIIVLAVSKISVPIFLHHLTPNRIHRRGALVVIATVCIWSTVSFIAAAVQCTPPRVWEIANQQCFDQHAFWLVYDSLNVVTESAIIALATATMWRIQVGKDTKAAVIGCFATRIFVLAAAVCQAVYTRTRPDTLTDPSFARWQVVVCGIFVSSLSIITACVPYIKAFYLNLESGMIRYDDQRRRGTSTSTYKTYSKETERRPSHFTAASAGRRPSHFTLSTERRPSQPTHGAMRLGSIDSANQPIIHNETSASSVTTER